MRQLLFACSVVVLAACSPALLAGQAGSGDSGSANSGSDNSAFREQFEQGQQALKVGKYKDAIESLKKANALQNNSCGECYLLMAVSYYKTGKLNESVENCDRAMVVATDDKMRATAHSLKGNALFAASGKDSKKMSAPEAEFRSAIQLNPKAPLFHLSLAKTLLWESKDDEAKQELQACLGLNADERLASEARFLLADPRRGREDFAPEFEISTLQGQQVSLKQLAGRIVVMDFWATWCPPCRASVPELKELTKKYPVEKLTLISVSADKDDSAWREFVAKKKMDWAQYRDADHKVLDAFGIHSFPTYLVIDGDGAIKERFTGMNPQETIVHRLKTTLSQMPQLEGEARK
ncbi:MAG TPA: redoxin family protein [Candidatus Angelobacter sp.]